MMKNARGIVLLIVALVLALLVHSSLFIVTEREQAIVTQLGAPVGEPIRDAGLKWKIPFIQHVNRFDKRLLEYDSAPTEILTKDKKNLVVDNYSKWKIANPLKFLQTVQNEAGAQARLDDILYSELRVELGRHNLIEIASTNRAEIMKTVTMRANEQAQEYGIEVKDVRIKRADLPSENQKAVYGRMRAEREREAKQYRSEGGEEAAKIRATADKERTIMLAEAYEQEQQIRGEGDAGATAVYAGAFTKDAEFYEFLRTLETYKKAFKEKTTVVLPPKTDFLKYFQHPLSGR